MDTEHGTEFVNGEPHNPSVTYDRSDLSARGILIFFLVLAIFGVLVQVAVVGMYAGLTKITEKHDPEGSPLAPKEVTPRASILSNTANVDVQNFPQPRLQFDDTSDMVRFLQKETAALTAGPQQDAQGIARVPIDRAMKAVLPKLPARAGGVAPPENPGAAREYSYPAEVAESTN
jgi:hypothetical protein